MARPTEDEVEDAIAELKRLTASTPLLYAARVRKQLAVLYEAVQPRPVWPVKEAADYLGVRVENLRPTKLRDLPEPAYEFPRPIRTDPGRTMRLFWADEIEAYKLVLEATPRRRNARDKAASDGD